MGCRDDTQGTPWDVGSQGLTWGSHRNFKGKRWVVFATMISYPRGIPMSLHGNPGVYCGLPRAALRSLHGLSSGDHGNCHGMP